MTSTAKGHNGINSAGARRTLRPVSGRPPPAAACAAAAAAASKRRVGSSHGRARRSSAAGVSYTIECHGVPMSTKHHGVPWSTIECHGAPSSTIHHGVPQSTIEYHTPWSTTEYHRVPWSTMDESASTIPKSTYLYETVCRRLSLVEGERICKRCDIELRHSAPQCNVLRHGTTPR
jgi:hypothetical protein